MLLSHHFYQTLMGHPRRARQPIEGIGLSHQSHLSHQVKKVCIQFNNNGYSRSIYDLLYTVTIGTIGESDGTNGTIGTRGCRYLKLFGNFLSH